MEYYVLGIGGTGMRCVESLIHLCAMGMFDDTTIHLLALDTDINNGNFKRLQKVKDAYLNVKSLDGNRRATSKESFFTANINYYEFSPDYQIRNTFKSVYNYDRTRYSNRETTDLADLMFSEKVEEFNLLHGYRAQTHLGSMMMYHSIIEAAQSPTPNGLKDFLNSLIAASRNGNPRVFILGSVFGGTGASSIPIIPQAISDAAGILANGAVDVLGNAYFGSTLLTAYFTFNAPTRDELNLQKIIATADKFALNSQVAMMFYQDDTTVKSTYQRFYMMGTPTMTWKPMNRDLGKVITGGSDQTNDSHYIEFLAASAALDFYQTNINTLMTNKNNHSTEYVYRAVNENGNLEFQDFAGAARAAELAKKMGMLTVASILCNNPEYDFISGIQNGNAKIMGFEDIELEQIKNLKKYFELFHFGVKESGELTEGWLRQLHRSAGGGNHLLFAADIFVPQRAKEIDDEKWNRLYRSDGEAGDKMFKVGLFENKYSLVKDRFVKIYDDGKDDKSATYANRMEQALKRLYDTLSSLYQFNKKTE